MTESLIGAIYLTYGLDVVRPAVIEAFTEHISFAERSYVDFKTELQEQLAKTGRAVAYRLVETIGPPHAREFVLEAVVDGLTVGRGVGASKKRAEQDAAAEALRELNRPDRPKRRRVRLRGRRKSPPSPPRSKRLATATSTACRATSMAPGSEAAAGDVTPAVADRGDVTLETVSGEGRSRRRRRRRHEQRARATGLEGTQPERPSRDGGV